MEIIILFIVISVISSIIKSIGKTQTAQQGEVGGIPPMNTYVDAESPEGIERDRPVKQHTSKPKRDNRVEFKKEINAPIQSRIDKAQKPDLNFKSLSHKRLVEGIILSEILGPPKSRRASFKN